MTPHELLADLEAAGASVSIEAGRLRVEAPPAVLAARRQPIAEHRDVLLALVAAKGTDVPVNAMPADVEVDEHVARVRSLSPQEQAGWRREVIHAAVWAAAGKRDDPHLLGDLRALQRMTTEGTCIGCNGPCSADGRFWCDGCAVRYERATEGQTK